MVKLRWYQIEACEAMQQAEGNMVVVMPTGAGKTLVISEFLRSHPGKVLVLSHVKEIIQQNYESLVRAKLGDIGLWSAGLGVKQKRRITVGSIQSVYKVPEEFEGVDLVLIDECHMVNHNKEGMYRDFVHCLGARCMGLTATPFRLKHGYIWEGETLFDGVCYDLSDQIPKLINQNYLCNVVTKAPGEKMDLSGVRTVQGEYSSKDLDEKFVNLQDVEYILDGTVKLAGEYKHWLIFAINISHATLINGLLNCRGVSSVVVHSNLSTEERDSAIQRYKDGEVQALVNVGILTIGFDAPHTDLIVMLRPTQSCALYAQMIGRGMRTSPGKTHCLVLDHAGNIERLGPIDNLNIDKNTGKTITGSGEAPCKECPKCHIYTHPRAIECDNCGYVFPPPVNLSVQASSGSLIGNASKVKWYNISRVVANKRSKKGSPNYFMITYISGLRMFHEVFCIYHSPPVCSIAQRKLMVRLGLTKLPMLEESDMLKFIQKNLRVPKKLEVSERGKYPEILSFVW